MVGVEFTFKDGTKESYDPLEIDGLTQTEHHYHVEATYNYEIEKSTVLDYRFYELCECGYELYNDECNNYGCKL